MSHSEIPNGNEGTKLNIQDAVRIQNAVEKELFGSRVSEKAREGYSHRPERAGEHYGRKPEGSGEHYGHRRPGDKPHEHYGHGGHRHPEGPKEHYGRGDKPNESYGHRHHGDKPGEHYGRGNKPNECYGKGEKPGEKYGERAPEQYGERAPENYGERPPENYEFHIEELMDSFAVGSNLPRFTNYLSDSNGKIIGEVTSPISKEVDARLFSSRNVSEWLKNPKSMPDGVQLEVNNFGKAVKLTNHIGENWYTQIGYDKSDIHGIKLDTIGATAGFEGGTDTIKYFAEGHVAHAKSSTEYDTNGNAIVAKSVKAGLSKEFKVSDTLDLNAKLGYENKIQSSQYDTHMKQQMTIIGAGAAYRPTDKVQMEGGVTHEQIKASASQYGYEVDGKYSANSIHGKASYTNDRGTTYAAGAEIRSTDLATEKEFKVSMKNADLSATGYVKTLKGKNLDASMFAPSDSKEVGVQVGGKLPNTKNAEWFAEASTSKIGDQTDKKVKGGIKFNF